MRIRNYEFLIDDYTIVLKQLKVQHDTRHCGHVKSSPVLLISDSGQGESCKDLVRGKSGVRLAFRLLNKHLYGCCDLKVGFTDP